MDSEKVRRGLLYYAGFMTLLFAATKVCGDVVRQWREAGTGHTYYGGLALAALLAAAGLALMLRHRRRP